jgi:hypothetical protein
VRSSNGLVPQTAAARALLREKLQEELHELEVRRQVVESLMARVSP